MTPLQITLNGEPRILEEGSTLAELVTRLELTGRVAIEVNAVVIRRALHAEHRLQSGDRVEIVTFVGGG